MSKFKNPRPKMEKIWIGMSAFTIIAISTPVFSQTEVDLRGSNEDPLAQVMSAQIEKKFTGTPITLKLKDADVTEVLRMIGETSGFNMVIHPSVAGRITLSLENVPWDQALDVVLNTMRLGAERADSILRVMPKEILIAEKQSEIDSKRLSSAAAPRVTRVFPVSYADPAQLATLLQNFANSQSSTPGASGVPSTIIVDANTQSLIIRDTSENIDRMRKMIEILDVQTPQVMIEAKVLEATEDFVKTINGGLQFGGTSTGIGANSAGGALLGSPILSLPASNATGSAGGALGATTIFRMPGVGSVGLSAVLSLNEKENKIKIVSSPRTVVLSGKTASINQSTSVGVPVTVQGAAGVIPTTQILQVTANTRLNVTPRVTNDGSVFMRLDLNRDLLNQSNPQAPVAAPRSMQTEVIVESGNTLVIGGVLNIDENKVSSGIPFLRKIPLLGALFGQESDTRTKSELMFFITPRILNQKKSGIGQGAGEIGKP